MKQNFGKHLIHHFEMWQQILSKSIQVALYFPVVKVLNINGYAALCDWYLTAEDMFLEL